MDKLAVVLAVVAVALGGYAAFGKSEPAGTQGYDTSVTDLADRLAALESQNEEYRALLGMGESMTAEGVTDGGAMDATAAGTLKGRAPLGVPKRMAELEARLADYDKRFESMEAQASEAKKSSPWHGGPSFLGKNKFLANLDQAEQALELDANQRAQMDRIIDTTRSELERLYDTPNDEGKTLKELMKPQTIKLGGDAEDSVVSLMGNFGKMRTFKKSKVPGTNETYAEAEKRIKDAGKRDARGLLNDDQQEKWDGSHTDPLFSPPGALGGATFAFGEVEVVAPRK